MSRRNLTFRGFNRLRTYQALPTKLAACTAVASPPGLAFGASSESRKLCVEWHGWDGFRRGIASNLYELGATDKVIPRILRHAKPHVTKERYIKAFDPAVLTAMKSLETSLEMLNNCSATVRQGCR